MERVIVTVKRYQETRVRDLDVPAGLESAKLAEVIAGALHWDQDAAGTPIAYNIKAHPPDRILGDRETLYSAGVADGAWLTLVPEGITIAPSAPQPAPPSPKQSAGPVKSWRSLGVNVSGIDTPPKAHDTTPPSQPDNPFVWREIDV